MIVCICHKTFSITIIHDRENWTVSILAGELILFEQCYAD